MKRIFPTTIGVLLAVWSYGAIAAYAHQPAPMAPAAAAQVSPVNRASPPSALHVTAPAEGDDDGD